MLNNNLRISQIASLVGLRRHTINARIKSFYDNSELQRNSGNQILLSPHQVKKIIKNELIHTKKGKVIYVGNLKGGVGKTTVSYLLTNALSCLGKKVCAIDLDVQSNLTRQYLDINVSQPVFFDVIDGKNNIKDIIVPLSATLDFIPSSLKNSLIQKSLSMQTPKHHLTWFNSICLDYLRAQYDIIIVDTPPHLTTLNSVFCLCLNDNDHIAVPACADDFSIMGVQMFLEDILSIRSSYKINSETRISVIINRFLQNQKTNLEMLVKMGQEYGKMLSEVIIKDSAKIRETVNNKITLGEIKQGKEVYEVIANLLQEFDICRAPEN